MLQLYFGHLSLAEVDSIIAQLWGRKKGAEQLSKIVPHLIYRLDRWLLRPIPEKYPYVFLHAADVPRRKPVGRSGARVAVIVGINERGYRELLGVHTDSTECEQFWIPLIEQLRERGMSSPEVVIADGKNITDSAVKKCWPSSALLPFASGLDQELLGEMGYNDRHLMVTWIARFRATRNETEAKEVAAKMMKILRAAGYYHLSAASKDILAKYLGYFAVPEAHRTELYRFELVRTEINRLREQTRVLGPIADPKVLTQFVAAGFRRLSRNSWNTKPVLSFG